MVFTTKIAILAVSAAALSGGGLILASSDQHPVMNMNDLQHPAVASVQHDLVPMDQIDGVDYDSSGRIISAQIDGLEQPASAPDSSRDWSLETPVS